MNKESKKVYKYTQLNFTLSPILKKKILEIAKKRDVSIGSLIRNSVRAKLGIKNETKK